MLDKLEIARSNERSPRQGFDAFLVTSLDPVLKTIAYGEQTGQATRYAGSHLFLWVFVMTLIQLN
jgi:hypothetical protein